MAAGLLSRRLPCGPVLRPAQRLGRPGLKLRLSRYNALLLFSKPVNAKFNKISWLKPRRLRLDAHRDPGGVPVAMISPGARVM